MKHVIVAGGAGFIGSHLCKRLINDGYKVTIIDNLSTGDIRNITYIDNIEQLIIKDVQYINNSADNLPDKVYAIINLACMASPIWYQLNPIETIKTSVFGAYNLLNIANHYKCKIIQASTSEIYGDPIISPQVEPYWGNVNPVGPRSCYDEGKRAAETLFYNFHQTYNLDTRIIRIFNTYGPNMQQNDGRVISNFIVQALNNEPITIYGNGNQDRSFMYVDDLVEGIMKVMSAPASTPGINMPINIGNPAENHTVKFIAEKIKRLACSTSPIIYKPLPGDDPKKRLPDITKAKNTLNWQPKITLEYGLKLTIDYFRAVKEQDGFISTPMQEASNF